MPIIRPTLNVRGCNIAEQSQKAATTYCGAVDQFPQVFRLPSFRDTSWPSNHVRHMFGCVVCINVITRQTGCRIFAVSKPALMHGALWQMHSIGAVILSCNEMAIRHEIEPNTARKAHTHFDAICYLVARLFAKCHLHFTLCLFSAKAFMSVSPAVNVPGRQALLLQPVVSQCVPNLQAQFVTLSGWHTRLVTFTEAIAIEGSHRLCDHYRGPFASECPSVSSIGHVYCVALLALPCCDCLLSVYCTSTCLIGDFAPYHLICHTVALSLGGQLP